MFAVLLVVVDGYFDRPVQVAKTDFFKRQCERFPEGVQVIVNALGPIDRVPFESIKKK